MTNDARALKWKVRDLLLNQQEKHVPFAIRADEVLALIEDESRPSTGAVEALPSNELIEFAKGIATVCLTHPQDMAYANIRTLARTFLDYVHPLPAALPPSAQERGPKPLPSEDERNQIGFLIDPTAFTLTTRPGAKAAALQVADALLSAGYRKSSAPTAPAEAEVTLPPWEARYPQVSGVGRMFDNDKALLVMLREKPSDDELRAFHDHITRKQREGQDE